MIFNIFAKIMDILVALRDYSWQVAFAMQATLMIKLGG